MKNFVVIENGDFKLVTRQEYFDSYNQVGALTRREGSCEIDFSHDVLRNHGNYGARTLQALSQLLDSLR